jgi:hypothetical protein
MAPRMPWTVDRWEIKERGLASVTQYAQDPETETYRYYKIPAQKILRFTHDQQGLNYEGVSVLRSAYKHYKVKDALYKIAAVSAERWGVGTIVGALPSQITDAETRKEFRDILKHLRSNEVGHIVLPPGSDIDACIKILTPDAGNPMLEHILSMIRHHDVLIARSVLAEFISLGETNFGSRSVSNDQLRFFLMSIESVAEYVTHVVMHGNPGECRGIEDLVHMNFGAETPIPLLSWHRIYRHDTAAIANSVAQLVQTGVIVPTEGLDAWARGLIGAPEEAQVNVSPTRREPQATTEPQCGHTKLQEGWRELHPWERRVKFQEYKATHSDLEDEFVREWRNTLDKQLAFVQSELGDTIEPDDLDKLRSMSIPYRGALVASLYAVLSRARQHGMHSVYDEINEGDGGWDDEWAEEDSVSHSLLVAEAEAAADALISKVERAITYYALPLLAAGAVVSTADIIGSVRDLSDRDAISEAQSAVRTSWGMGRTAGSERSQKVVKQGWYSAILDDNVCSECEPRDGTPVMPGEIVTPNPDCLGESKCRCITVWELVPGADLASAWDED